MTSGQAKMWDDYDYYCKLCKHFEEKPKNIFNTKWMQHLKKLESKDNLEKYDDYLSKNSNYE